MAAEAKFIVSAQDKTAAAMQSAKKNFYVGEKAVDAMASKLAALASIGALTGLAAKVANFAGSCVQEFATAERAQLRLQAALGNGAGFDKAMNLIDILGRSYNGSKDDIDGVVSALAALGKNSSQIEAITKASVNLANTTGQDLNTSYLQLAETFEGKVSAKLTKLIPELRHLTAEQLKAGGATDLINAKLSAMSEVIAGGAAQRITNLAESFGDLKENLGKDAFDMFSPVVKWLQDIIDRTNDAIAANRLHKQVMKEGANASLSDRVQDTGNQLADAVKGRQQTLRSEGLGSFETWLKNQRGLDEKYNKNDAASRQKYNLEFSQIVSRMAKEDDEIILQLQTELTKYTKQLEENTKALKEEPKPSGAGTGIDPGTANISDSLRVSQFKLGLTSLGNVPQGLNSSQTAENTGLGSFNPFDGMGKFGEILTSLVGVTDSLIGQFLPLIASMSTVNQIMNPLTVIFQGIMDVLGPVIDSLLTPLIGILRVFGQLIGTFIVPVLNMLLPVIMFITKAFVWLYNNALVPFQNGFIDILENISNFFISIMNGVIDALNHIPFVDIGKVSRANFDNQKAKKISLDDVVNGGTPGAAASSGGTSGGGSGGATYTGVKDVTINIYYDHSYINGDAREIAINLRQEIKLAEAMGY